MEPKYIVEAIEDGYVRCEDYHDASQSIVVEKDAFPKDIKEGDVLAFDEGHYIILKEETLKKQERIQKKFERLLKRGN